jgi:hypothetical protein
MSVTGVSAAGASAGGVLKSVLGGVSVPAGASGSAGAESESLSEEGRPASDAGVLAPAFKSAGAAASDFGVVVSLGLAGVSGASFCSSAAAGFAFFCGSIRRFSSLYFVKLLPIIHKQFGLPSALGVRAG